MQAMERDVSRRPGAGGATATAPGGAPDGTYPSTCWECSTLCGSLVTVQDGRVRKIVPNAAHPASKGAFCVKGILGAPGWTYAPERLRHPLRRVGERGAGRWERVSWDDALDLMADRLAAVRARHGPLALVGAVSGAFFSRGATVDAFPLARPRRVAPVAPHRAQPSWPPHCALRRFALVQHASRASR